MTKKIRAEKHVVGIAPENAIRKRRRQIDLRRKEHGISSGTHKARALIRLVSLQSGDDLSLLDRKILNLLQERAVADIKAEERGEGVFKVRGFNTVKISTISALTGINDYSHVRDSLMRLATTEVRYDVLEEDTSNLFEGVTSLFAQEIQVVSNPYDEDAEFRFAFPESVMAMLREPQPYAFVNLSNVFSFTSKYSVALYENLCLHMHMNSRTWTVGVENLMDLLGYPRVPGKTVDFSKLRVKAIEYAMTEINELDDLSAFRVEATYNVDAMSVKARRIGSVTFRILENYSNKSKGIPYSETSQAKKEGAKSGLNISNPCLTKMVDRYHKVLGQKTRGETGELILKIWQMRVMQNDRVCEHKDEIGGLEKRILQHAKPHAKQELRDQTFVAVLEREAAHDWDYSVPEPDSFAVERVKGAIEKIGGPAAHGDEFSVMKPVDPYSITRKAQDAQEIRSDMIHREAEHLRSRGKDVGLDIEDMVISTDYDLEKARRLVKEYTLLWEIRRQMKRDEINRRVGYEGDFPINAPPLESHEDDSVPF